MKVRAKFRCNSVEDYGNSKKAKLSPVTGAEGEDKAFWEATPSGTLEMSVTHAPVQEFFKPGKTYYLDFEATT